MSYGEVTATDISLEVKERQIAAREFVPEQLGHCAVLLVHGYDSSLEGYDAYATTLAQEVGAVSLVVHLTGHGNSPGIKHEATLHSHLDEIRAGFDHLSGHEGVDPNRIGVVAADSSGHLAAILTETRTPHSLLLRAPAIVPNEWEDKPFRSHDQEELSNFRYWETQPASPNLRPLKALREYDGKVTVVFSGHDLDVSRRSVAIFAEHARKGSGTKNSVLKQIGGARHELGEVGRQKFLNIQLAWAQEL